MDKFYPTNTGSRQAATAVVVKQLQGKFPNAMDVLERGTGVNEVPKRELKQICPTNPLERLNRQLRQRLDVVGIFPNRESAQRLRSHYPRAER
ncbi:MAG: transposase [Alicyclobacillus sp.]|nr:transposase [Alicyclobacillus sp.]